MIYDANGKPIDVDSLTTNPTVSTEQKQTVNDMIGTIESNLSGVSQEEVDRSNDFYKTLHEENSLRQEDTTYTDNPSWGYLQQHARALDLAEKTGTIDQITTSLSEDPDVKFQQLKQATHDYAHMDSAEQGVVDWFHIQAAKRRQSDIVEKSEAEMRAKEAGVDLKFDKPLTEGELEYSINKQLRKKELEKQVAYYRGTGDYNALQEMMLMGSALSGGMGFIETAATIGLTFAGGEGVAWGLGRAAQILGKTTSITKGVYNAQRVAYATRMAQNYGNIFKEAQVANDAAKAAEATRKLQYWSSRASQAEKAMQGASFGENFGYDAYRFGKQVSGQHGSMASTMASFSIDGAMSTVPAELIKWSDSEVTHTGEYSSKDMVTSILAGAAFGAAMPVAGAGLKKVPGALGKVTDTVAESIAAEKNKKVAEGLLKQDIGLVNEAEATGDSAAKILDDIVDVARDKGNLANAEEALATAMAGQNVNEAEFQNAMFYTINSLKKGQYPNIDALPIRNMYYSDVHGMLDTITQLAKDNKNGLDVIDHLTANGIHLDTKGAKVTTDALQQMKDVLTEGKAFGSFAKIAEENKALGRLYTFGLSQEDANKFLGNVYLARMGGETDASIQAGLAAEEAIAKLQSVRKQLQHIVDTYNIVEHSNDAARRAGRKADFNLSYQNNAYNILADGISNTENTTGDLKTALENIANLMLPDDLAKEGRWASEIKAKAMMEQQIAGSLTETSIEDFEKAIATLAEIEQWQMHFLDNIMFEEQSKNGKYFFQRLKAIGDTKSQTEYLQKLADQIDAGILDNANLLNSDRIFEQGLETPEQILKRIEGTNEVSELSYIYNQNNKSAADMKKLIADKTDTLGKLETAKANLAMFDNTKTKESIDEILGIISKQNEAGSRLTLGYLHGTRASVQAIEEIMNTSAGAIRNRFIELVHGNKYLQAIAKEEGALTAKTLLRVSAEEGSAFADLLKQAVTESITSKLPAGSFGRKFNEMFDSVAESFTDYLRAHPDEAMTNLSAPHGFNAEVNTAEEITGEVVAATRQKELYDSLLENMFTELTDAAALMQARLLNEQTNTFKLWERCLETPGKMSEVILGDVTMTWLPRKGASASIENIAGIDTEFKQFLQDLDAHSMNNEKLSEYAMDSAHYEEIRDAIADSWMALNNMLSEEEKYTFERTVANTQAGRVAKAFLDSHARVHDLLYNLGSGTKDITKLFNASKLSMSDSKLLKNAYSTPFYSSIQDIALNSKYEGIKALMSRMIPQDTSKDAMRTTNNAVHFFENLDLDKHFGKGKPTKIGLNELRDSLVKGVPLDNIIKDFGEKDVTTALKKIVEGIQGSSTNVGLLRRLWTGSKNISEELASHKSKYLEDLGQALHYKSAEAFKQDLKFFGYDDMKSWFEASVGGGKKAYAVMSKAGAEPFQYYQNIIDMARVYANNIAPLKHGDKNAKALQDSLSNIWASRMRFAVNQVCGTYSSVPSTGMRIAQSIIRFLSSPMLMKAGIKSLSDYAYQYQYLVTTGLRSSTDLSARYDVYKKLLTSCTKDKKLLNDIYMSQQLRTNVMFEMLYNEPIGNGMLKKFGDLNEWAPMSAKIESASKAYSTTMLDKLAWIGPLTQYNRMNAAYNVMQSLGDFSDTTFAQIKQNKRLFDSLNRFGITETEWDDVLSKKAVMSVNDYVSRMHQGEQLGELGSGKLFFPELLLDMTDDEVTAVMKKQNIPVTKENIISYRQSLVDKASMIVNVSANEMTTIPTARIQGALYFGQDPNSWVGMGLGALTQFQSFGTGVNFYHWGRRLAAHMDPDDEMFNKMLLCLSGSTSTATDMAGFISELALFQFFLNEAVAGLAGTRKVNTDNGEIRGDVLTEKITRAFIDQAGVMGPMLDAIVTNFQKGRGQGGGIALSLLPSGSSVLGQAGRVVQAATKESTANNRAQAVGGALLQNAAYYTGIPNLAYTQAAWNFLIGDKLTEWQQGDNYNRYMSQRANNGYVPSWVQNLADKFAF